MYRLSELRSLVFRDLAHPTLDNDRLTAIKVDEALNQGYKHLAQLCRSFARTEERPAVTNQSLYTILPDFVDMRAVHYDDISNRLRESSRRGMETDDRLWRNAPGSTPQKWLWWDARQIYIHPKPVFATGTHKVMMEGLVGPYSIGNGIATIARVATVKTVAASPGGAVRTSNVVTITTTGAHGLLAGQTVLVEGVVPVGATDFNGEFTIATVPSGTTFTYAQTAANDTGGGGTVTTGVVTATTNKAHGLHRVGMNVVIYGVTASAFDGSFAITDLTAAPTTFKYVQNAASASSTGGIVGYENGVLPLYDDDDMPLLLAHYQTALVDFAVSILAGGYLLDAQEAPLRIQSANGRLEAKTQQLRAMLD